MVFIDLCCHATGSNGPCLSLSPPPKVQSKLVFPATETASKKIHP